MLTFSLWLLVESWTDAPCVWGGVLLLYSALQILLLPVTVDERSKACTVFARSEAGIVGSNPTQGMDVWCVCVCVCVFLCLCTGRGLATS
jgi:hypothetical protein